MIDVGLEKERSKRNRKWRRAPERSSGRGAAASPAPAAGSASIAFRSTTSKEVIFCLSLPSKISKSAAVRPRTGWPSRPTTLTGTSTATTCEEPSKVGVWGKAGAATSSGRSRRRRREGW
jgi:hypothetical protein